MKKKIFKIAFIVLAAMAAVMAAPHMLLLSLPLVGMALTARTSQEGNTASDQIISIAFSDTTGGGGAVTVVDGDEEDKLISKTDTFKGWFGDKSIRKEYTLDFWVRDIKTGSTEQFLADLENKAIAYVQVAYADGVVKTLDSGTTGVPVMGFKVDWENKNKALGWHVVGTGKVGITTTTP